MGYLNAGSPVCRVVQGKNGTGPIQKCKSLKKRGLGENDGAGSTGRVAQTDIGLGRNGATMAYGAKTHGYSPRRRAPSLNTSAHTTAGQPAAAATARRGASAYVCGMLLVGCGLLLSSLMELWAAPPPAQWWVLVAITLISGSATLKLPSIPANFSISDIFTLTGAVVFGAPAGTVLVAIDSLVISKRLARHVLPLERVLFNASAPPVAMWLSAQLFFRASGLPALSERPIGIEVIVPWLLAFAGLYFVLNTFAIATAIGLHQRVSVFAIWRTHFQNLWLTFIGGAVGAVLVVFAMQMGRYGIGILSLPLVIAAILHFAYRNATGRVADQLDHLAEVNRLHLSTIEALAHAIDAKDSVTHGHIRRVQSWAVSLASRIGFDDSQELRALEAAALLHDIGKIAVPEHILNKPTKLTPSEFDRMKTHATVGAEILSEVEFPYPVVPIVRHHHENWDGSGYPDGLHGRDIPIGARILAVVDCFDALTSDRPYRRALSTSEALAIITSRRGTMYDPTVVDAFRELCSTQLQSLDSGARAAPRAESTEVAAAHDGTSLEREQVRIAMNLGAALASASGPGMFAEALREVAEVDSVAVYAVDDRQHCLVPTQAAGQHARALARITIPIGERISGWVAANHRSIVNGDPRLELVDSEVTALRSAIAIPCTAQDGSRAVITLYSTKPEAFSARDERLIEAAASFLDTSDYRLLPMLTRQERSRPWNLTDREDGVRGSWPAAAASGPSVRRHPRGAVAAAAWDDPRR